MTHGGEGVTRARYTFALYAFVAIAPRKHPMILRILFFAVFGWLLLSWARGRARRARVMPPVAREAQAASASVPMKVCAHCGILLPEPEALRSGDKHYCCAEHRRAGSGH